MLTGITEVHMG